LLVEIVKIGEVGAFNKRQQEDQRAGADRTCCEWTRAARQLLFHIVVVVNRNAELVQVGGAL
jgi:hypothetical protein